MNETETAFFPITAEELHRDLSAAGVRPGMNLMVHISLSSIGWVVGGAETLIRVLIDLVGPDGHLMMPAQTWKNLDPSTGVHWDVPEAHWDLVRQQWPAFDPLITPVIGMGVCAEMFRTWPGTVRSNHPARSFSVRGPKAAWVAADHNLSNIFGQGSPLDKFQSLGSHILLLGVDHNKNTSLHVAETQADLPNKPMSTEYSAILQGGKRVWAEYRTLAVDDEDFVELGHAYDVARSIPIHKVGQADARLLDMGDLIDWARVWMEKNRK